MVYLPCIEFMSMVNVSNIPEIDPMDCEMISIIMIKRSSDGTSTSQEKSFAQKKSNNLSDPPINYPIPSG